MLGPVVGSLLYTVLSYMNTFLALAFLLFSNMVLVCFALPPSLNYVKVEEKIDTNMKQSNGDIKEDIVINYSLFFKNRSSVLMLISLVLICIY